MPATPEYTAVRTVLEQYIAASFTGNVPLLKEVFHPDALMAGFLGEVLELGTPEPFYAELEANPSPESAGEDYRAEIAFIHISGPAASAAIVEESLLGSNFINYFHLLRIDERWLIVAKTFRTVA